MLNRWNTRWTIRVALFALLLTLAPSAPCAMDHAVRSRDWAATISWVAGADRRSAQEAIQLIHSGQSGLALVRLDTSGQRSRGTLSMARLLSAWVLAETVHSFGALPAPGNA
jgi:hypothetical protein